MIEGNKNNSHNVNIILKIRLPLFQIDYSFPQFCFNKIYIPSKQPLV